jgi:hypothetical protein
LKIFIYTLVYPWFYLAGLNKSTEAQKAVIEAKLDPSTYVDEK